MRNKTFKDLSKGCPRRYSQFKCDMRGYHWDECRPSGKDPFCKEDNCPVWHFIKEMEIDS